MLDPSRVEPVPWRNGAGSTRELAASGGPDATSWRISLASLDHDAPFSVFPGIDRLFVALGPLRLTVDGAVRSMRAADQARFPGEATVAVSVAEPTSALNVMTARGGHRAEVVLRGANEPVPEGVAATVLLRELVERPGVVADVRLVPPVPGSAT